jgi:hypothetical protein
VETRRRKQGCSRDQEAENARNGVDQEGQEGFPGARMEALVGWMSLLILVLFGLLLAIAALRGQ